MVNPNSNATPRTREGDSAGDRSAGASSSGSGALAGVRVIDITSVLMGPSATQMLAELGADVIKVEPPEGDIVRSIGPQGREKGLGPVFLGANRGKRSIALDLKSEAGREALIDLVHTADVLAYNVRPQAMERLGLGWEALAAVNPQLLYVGMFGFSQRGPMAASAAFDDLIQAASALPDALAMSAGGIPRYVPFNIADRMVGLYAFGVISAALHGRSRTGIGQRIDIPMFETFAAQIFGDHLYGQTFIPPQGDFGYPRLLSPERRPYRTLDGHVCCLIYTDTQWRNFLRVTGKPDLFEEDPRFASIATRTAHITDLYAIVADELSRRTTAQWQELLASSDIPVFPMHTFETLLGDPHLEAIGFFREVDHPAVGRIRETAVPSEWSGTPPAPARTVPQLGEHTREVLREMGYDDARIEQMIADGAARVAP
jgi:crotonobetainyl-CoA:carnitine CoA-transferase CaiB-like acyl-CoA transferase